MTEKQLAAALVKAMRARQRFDKCRAKARKSRKIDTPKFLLLAQRLHDAAQAIAKL